MVTYWSVPPMWVGRTVAVMASGPSMSQEVADKVRAARLPAIAVNNTYRLAPWADLLYAADEEWWNVNRHVPAEFPGFKVSVSSVAGVMRLCNTGPEGFDDDRSCVRTGKHSGYQAVHIAAHTGAKRIILCGFDMKGGHWHAEHERPLRTTDRDLYPIWAQRFDGLATELAKRGIEVVNTSMGSAITAFKFMPVAEACAQAQADAK